MTRPADAHLGADAAKGGARGEAVQEVVQQRIDKVNAQLAGFEKYQALRRHGPAAHRGQGEC